MTNISSQLTLIGIGDAASPEVYNTIPQCTSISGPDGSSTEINVTNLSSTAHEFILGLKDEGSIQLSLIFEEANTYHALLRTRFNSGAANNFRITDAAAAPNLYTFSAFVQGLSMSYGVDDVNRAEVSLRVSGAITVST